MDLPRLEKRIRRSGLLVVAAWTLVVAASLLWGVMHEFQSAREMASKVARSHLDKDKAFRQWVSARGGLYAPISELTQPNPYMRHVANQDIRTPVGPMTLLNPAHILRLLMDEYDALYGIKGRIVGLKALNPNNLADPWETRVIAILDGDRTRQEHAEISDVGGKSYLRMMVPMVMQADCMKCHAHLGYKMGDLRGGVNVSVPLDDYYATARSASVSLGITHGGIWLLGLIGVGFVTTRTLRDARQREDDIDELKLAAHVFDDGLQAIMIADGEGRIQRVNRRFSEITGFSAKEAIGSRVNIMKSGRHDREFYESMWRSILENGVWQGEIVNRKKCGEHYHVRESIVTLFDDSGKPRNFISQFEDITERKLAEERLHQSYEELERRVSERTAELRAAKEESERANQAKSEFLSQMSHELRTPLNAILGFTQLMSIDERQGLTESQRENVDQVMRAGTHLLDLINDILDLARVETGKIPLTIESAELAPLVEESVSLIRAGCESRALTLIVDDKSAMGTRVMCDPVRMRQILLNLLSNAVKYNCKNGVIRLEVSEARHGRIRVAVRDSGQGMTTDELARLFSPFERLPRHAHIQGTGIGLAFSKKLIEAMNGEIGASINDDTGMTFWLELPRAADLSNAQNVQNVSPVMGAAAPPTSRRDAATGTVLYIEDNPANMELVARIIRARGDVLVEAQSPRLGLELAEDRRPDLILLDIQMPEMSGFEVLAELQRREATRDIPVIAVSANAMQSDVARARAAGFVDYVTKPFELTAFGDVLDRYLGRGSDE